MVDKGQKREEGGRHGHEGRVCCQCGGVAVWCGGGVWPTLRLVIAALIAGTLHSTHHGSVSECRRGEYMYITNGVNVRVRQ